MVKLVRRSLLAQLLGVYLVLVLIVIGSGVEINAVGQRQIHDQIQTTDLSLAQEVAFDTYTTINASENSLVQLEWAVAGSVNDPAGMRQMFTAFKVARSNVDRMYWLDATGALGVSVPADPRAITPNAADTPLFQQAEASDGPVVGGGILDPVTSNDVVTVAEAVHGSRGQFLGVVATTLLLDDLSTPLGTVMAAQTLQGQHVVIRMVDAQGHLIASRDPQLDHLLQPEAGVLPGVSDALAGTSVSYDLTDAQGQGWLYSAVPVPAIGWGVVVQRPASDLTDATNTFRVWLLLATILFALGGLFFWMVLLRRVVRPLHSLAVQHGALPPLGTANEHPLPMFAGRSDEVGHLTRSLQGLKHDVVVQLAELRTLLDTSNAVVNSLDPRAVAETIIREVQRLVDVQAAAVLVPDEEGTLRVLASEGRAEAHDAKVHVRPNDLTMPSARALFEGRPVQMIDDGNPAFPAVAASEGFRAVLAIPIRSQHVGGVVLTVHRREPLPFTENEVDLLLTFANYATLAWEHAVLYERSDERLREIARENERLYHQATSEKQTLAAIMDSMSDGLLLTSADGTVLYTNPGARALIGMSDELNGDTHMEAVHEALAALAAQPDEYRRQLQRAEAGELSDWLLEVADDRDARAIHLRLFDVRDDAGEAIGRGLLLRDVTRERELDQFKSTLLAAVGHELRTPLTAIKGHASTLLLDDVAWSQEEQRHFLGTISAEADRLAQLVTNLLDLSRLEAGLLALHRTPRPLRDIIEAAAQRTSAPPDRLALDIADDLPLVEVDAPRIEVVVRNLISNALAYGDGRIDVSAVAAGDVVRVAVADHGPGIGDDDLPRIFERFYRARHTQHQTGGTGLGLAICKAFVEAHGGTIWAESGPGGTRISFTLPVAPVDTETTLAGEAIKQAPRGQDELSTGRSMPLAPTLAHRDSGRGAKTHELTSEAHPGRR